MALYRAAIVSIPRGRRGSRSIPPRYSSSWLKINRLSQFSSPFHRHDSRVSPAPIIPLFTRYAISKFCFPSYSPIFSIRYRKTEALTRNCSDPNQDLRRDRRDAGETSSSTVSRPPKPAPISVKLRRDGLLQVSPRKWRDLQLFQFRPVFYFPPPVRPLSLPLWAACLSFFFSFRDRRIPVACHYAVIYEAHRATKQKTTLLCIWRPIEPVVPFVHFLASLLMSRSSTLIRSRISGFSRKNDGHYFASLRSASRWRRRDKKCIDRSCNRPSPRMTNSRRWIRGRSRWESFENVWNIRRANTRGCVALKGMLALEG